MDQIKTLYNADCPVCNFEIKHYIHYTQKQGLPFVFEDLNGSDVSEWGLTPDQAMRRMYVLHNGTLTSGIPAFLILWRNMPRYRLVARFIALPVIKQLAILIYDYVAAPLIYANAKRIAKRKVQGHVG